MFSPLFCKRYLNHERSPFERKNYIQNYYNRQFSKLFFLLIFKFVGGILGNSTAMIADAVHSLSDFVTDIIVIVFVRISGKPEDENHDYGHGKYETLATAVIGIILFFVGIGILINAISSISDFFQGKQLKAPGTLALLAASATI